MPRANKHFIPGYIWHITHRCHDQEFLLKFSRDRQRWVYWLFEAKKRFGLCVLNYSVTSNHIHLLVKDTEEETIPNSIQLIAGRTAQEYNLRKKRKGAFWEDRYHATAVEADGHLIRCLVYIDLNMVRAGVIHHPSQWAYCGYNEIQKPPQRYRLIDQAALQELCGMKDIGQFRKSYQHWVETILATQNGNREPNWTESIAVGSKSFIEETKKKLGIAFIKRKVFNENGERFALREPHATYKADFDTENADLSNRNRYNWNNY